MIAFRGQHEVDMQPDNAFEALADMSDLHRWNLNVR